MAKDYKGSSKRNTSLMSMDDPLHLIESYLDDELEPEDEAKLMKWLSESQEHRQVFIREIHQHRALRVACLTRQAMAELDATLTNFSQGSTVPLRKPSNGGLAEFWRSLTSLSRPVWVRSICIVCIGLLIGLAWWTYWTLPSPVLKATGTGVVIMRGRARMPATGEIGLRARDEIHVSGRAGAIIRYGSEPTQIELEPGTVAMVTQTNRTRWIHLNRGILYASVARQRRGSSLVFVSPQGQVTVLGTELRFSVEDGRTAVEVYSGKVRLCALEGQSAVEVSSGFRGIVNETRAPESEQIAPAEGKILWEYWKSLPGDKIRDLTTSPRFPDHPDGQTYLNSFEQPNNWDDHFGSRIRGLLCPQETGDYTFWIAADDAGELWLSPTDLPARKERICFTALYTAPHDWEKRPDQRSRAFHLIGGRKYYIEAIMKEGGGSDCLAVAWQGSRLTRSVILGKYLSPVGAAKVPSAR